MRSGLTFKVNRSALKKLEKQAEKASRQGAEALLAASRENVPVDTGRLRDSGQVVADSDGAAAGYTADYAVYVHERTWVTHPNGKAKFLEDAAYDGSVKSAMLAAAGDAYRELLK